MKKIYLLLLLTLGIKMIAISQVGIGTANPSTSSILELKSSTKGLLFPRTSTTTRMSMTGAKGLMIYDTTVHQFFYHTGNGWLNLLTGQNHWTVSQMDPASIFANNTGNVGIGGADFVPYKFSVFGTVFVQETPKTTIRLGGFASTTEARILWELASNTMDYNITQNLNHLYISRTTGPGFVNDIVLDPNGLVGIGTNDPEVKLNVEGGTDVGNSSGGYLQLGIQSGINMGFDNNEIQARDNGAVSQLVLNNGGGPVRIGNALAPAGYSLSVNGKAICEELKIQDSSNWPDYVFQDEYSLRSLSDLRKFIHVNNHLPNIPSAKEIETEGLMIGDMQKRMMEKIEELTLYILQLEEKYSNLRAELETLKSNK